MERRWRGLVDVDWTGMLTVVVGVVCCEVEAVMLVFEGLILG